MLDDFFLLNSDRLLTIERPVFKKMKVKTRRKDPYQSKFQLAQKHLTCQANGDIELYRVTGCNRIFHLAYILCELGKPQKVQTFLSEKIQIIEKLGLQDISSGWCSNFLLAETLLLQKLLNK